MKPNTVIMGFHELAPSDAMLSETHLLKDLKYSKIGRTEVVEYFSANDFFPTVIIFLLKNQFQKLLRNLIEILKHQPID